MLLPQRLKTRSESGGQRTGVLILTDTECSVLEISGIIGKGLDSWNAHYVTLLAKKSDLA